MKTGRALELLGTFTAEQWGMVTAQQAKGLNVDGVTLHRLEKAGYLDRVRRSVYVATTATVTEAREEQAAWLALRASEPAWKRPLLDPDGGVLSHQSAARLHGLGELVNDRIALTTPRRRTSRDPDLWFKTAQLADDDVTVVDRLPVTTALRTICDFLDQHIDGSHIATIIRQAVEANLVQLDVLAKHIGPYALRYGVRRPGDGEALLEQLLAEIGTTTSQLAHRPAPPRTAAAAALAHKLAEYSSAASPIMKHVDYEIAGMSMLRDSVFQGIDTSVLAAFGAAQPTLTALAALGPTPGVLAAFGAAQPTLTALAALGPTPGVLAAFGAAQPTLTALAALGPTPGVLAAFGAAQPTLTALAALGPTPGVLAALEAMQVQVAGSRAGDANVDTGSAADDAAGNDGGHAIAAAEHAQQLRRLPESQGKE